MTRPLCSDCGQVHEWCSAHRNKVKPLVPCNRRPRTGSPVCHLHGGNAPAVKAKAAERRREMEARTALQTFGIVEDASDLEPVDVYAELQYALARNRFTVEWLRQQVAALGASDLSYETITREQKTHPYVLMLQQSEKSLTDLLVQCARLGIEDKAATAQMLMANNVSSVLLGVFSALVQGLALDKEQQTLARSIVERELLALEA